MNRADFEAFWPNKGVSAFCATHTEEIRQAFEMMLEEIEQLRADCDAWQKRVKELTHPL